MTLLATLKPAKIKPTGARLVRGYAGTPDDEPTGRDDKLAYARDHWNTVGRERRRLKRLQQRADARKARETK